MRLRSNGNRKRPIGLLSLLSALYLALCLATSGGCALRSVPEHATIREGMDQATRTIRAEHKEWSQDLHDGKPLPKLDDFMLKNRMSAHQAYEDLVNADRANDKK